MMSESIHDEHYQFLKTHPNVKRLFGGDNLKILEQYLPLESIDLIYVDPPFFTKRIFEVETKDGKFNSFDDNWDNNIGKYLDYMKNVFAECHRVLKSSGSLYLHCDWHASHYLKIELDKIFGYDNFRNEIVWKRSIGHPLSIKKFESITDTIFVYGKTKNVHFYPIEQPLSIKTIQRDYKKKDEHGYYQTILLTGGKKGGEEAYYPFKGAFPSKGRAWSPPRREKLPKWAADKLHSDYEKMNQLEKCYALDEIGLIYWSKKKTPRFKRYLSDSPTRFATNLWDDINAISSQSNERVGYPTQKPLALLERIIQSATKEGDMVLDPFCGSGTAIIASEKLNRHWIGIDISKFAVIMTNIRMRKMFDNVEFEINYEQNTIQGVGQ